MYFRVRFPDVGPGQTRLYCYVEGDSEADVRELAANHRHFRQWDTWAVLKDGTVLQRSSDAGESIERTPDRHSESWIAGCRSFMDST